MEDVKLFALCARQDIRRFVLDIDLIHVLSVVGFYYDSVALVFEMRCHTCAAALKIISFSIDDEMLL